MFDSIAPSPLKKSLKGLVYISELYNSQFFCTTDQKRHNHAPVSLSALFINPIFIPSLIMNTSDLFFSPSTQKQYLKKSCCTICLHLWMSPFWKMLFDWIELVWIPFKTLTHHLSLSSVLHSLSILTHLLSEVIKIIFTISPSRGGESPPHYHSCLRGWLWDGRSSATELSLGRPSRLSLLMAAWGWIAAHLISYYWISLFPHCCQSSLHLLPKI